MRTEREQLTNDLTTVNAEIDSLPPQPQVYALVSHAPRPIHVLNRGDVEQPEEEVGPGEPVLRSGSGCHGFPRGTTRGHAARPWRNGSPIRTTCSPGDPIVNRVWHYHFGRGIVDTPNDFGRNGSRPTHPALLDWLAVTFRDGGGSLKDLHRLICRSAVYRQASTFDPEAAALDAENHLLWRQNRRRLEAEEIRDATLFVAGRLRNEMGGPGFALFRFKDDHSPVYDHDDPAWIDPPEGRRRTVYRFVVRSVPNPFIECLDGADPNQSVPVRNTTITALQALALLNDPFMIAQAEAFAKRLEERQRRTGCAD